MTMLEQEPSRTDEEPPRAAVMPVAMLLLTMGHRLAVELLEAGDRVAVRRDRRVLEQIGRAHV